MGRLAMMIVLGAVALAAAVVGFRSTAARGSSAAPPVAAAPPRGATAFELVGRLEQPELGSAQFTGYVTSVAGIPDGAVFTNPAAAGAATARITLVGTLAVSGHVFQDPLFVTHGSGTIRVYVNPAGGGSLDDPASLARGELVATAAVGFQDVLNPQSDTRGIETGFLDLRQLTSRPFTLAGKLYRFGRVGQRLRATTAGEGIRTLQPLRRTVIAGGNALVTG